MAGPKGGANGGAKSQGGSTEDAKRFVDAVRKDVESKGGKANK